MAASPSSAPPNTLYQSVLTRCSIYAAPRLKKDSPSVLLYLPPGPIVANPATEDENIIHRLSTHLRQPVVKINYRFSQDHRFPTPIHDVLAGYDWVRENLLSKSPAQAYRRSANVARVGVYGSYIGGALATALALTECRVNEPGVVAAILSNPILDWVSLDDPAEPKKSRSPPPSSPSPNADKQPSLIPTLLKLRPKLFTKPGHYFDPFASPMLFFRSPGVDVPTPPLAPADDLEHLSLLEREVLFSNDPALEMSELVRDTDDAAPGQSSRKASRRFPSKNLGLRLPAFYIESTWREPLLVGQAAELASQLRRSFVRQRKDAMTRGSGFGRKALEEWEGEEMTGEEKRVLEAGIADGRRMVRVETGDDGPGVDDAADGRDSLERMVEWLRSTTFMDRAGS